MKNSNGELTADPKGCDHIIRFGNRSQHEGTLFGICIYFVLTLWVGTCEFRNDDFIMIDNSKDAAEESQPLPSTGPVLLPCSNKEDGCFFLAAAPEELASHLNECSYERLRYVMPNSLLPQTYKSLTILQEIIT